MWQRHYEAHLGVQFTTWGPIRHLRVWKITGKDGIPWDTLQVIKNELLGATTTAVEVYPAASDKIDEANMRHLWEIPEHFVLPFGLHPRIQRSSS